MRIAVVGAGYVGLVSGVCFAEAGHLVTCIDLDAKKVASLREGKMPIYEPGLQGIVASNSQAGRLAFTTDLSMAVADADVVFIAVGTPARPDDGHADLSFVFSAAASIAKAVAGFTVVVTKSTVPVGSGDEIEAAMLAANPNANVTVVSNPEFLREGKAIQDFQRPDRIIIGTDDERARAVMRDVYAPLPSAPLIFTSRRTAELIKYAANSFLALKVTFINEIADLCENAGADVEDVAIGIGMDKRIGAEFLRAGPGFGGSCFPKDTAAFVNTAERYKSRLRLIETTMEINAQRKISMANKVIAACGGSVRGKTIGVLGLTFKADTDDMREAPSIPIIETLLAAGARIRAYDPEGMEAAKALVKDIELADSPYDVAQDVDALVLITDWLELRELDFERLKQVVKSAVFVDLRNAYQRHDLEKWGFRHVAVGRS